MLKRFMTQITLEPHCHQPLRWAVGRGMQVFRKPFTLLQGPRAVEMADGITWVSTEGFPSSPAHSTNSRETSVFQIRPFQTREASLKSVQNADWGDHATQDWFSMSEGDLKLHSHHITRRNSEAYWKQRHVLCSSCHRYPWGPDLESFSEAMGSISRDKKLYASVPHSLSKI